MSEVLKLDNTNSPSELSEGEDRLSWDSLSDFAKTIESVESSPGLSAVKELVEERKDYERFMADFDSALSNGIDGAEDSKSQEIQNIRNFFSERLQSGMEFSVQEIATVLYALKDRGDDEGVVGTFEAGKQFGADAAAPLKEFYAVSLNKIGRVDDSIEVLSELMQDDNTRVGEVAGILGKDYKIKSQNAEALPDKVEYMQKSVDALRDGFYQTYEYYPGINLVYNQIELANLKDGPELISKAFDDAELVMYATKKAGAENTSDYWAAATLLEASVFAGEVSQRMIDNCLATTKNDWELESTLGNLKNVANTIDKQLESGNIDAETAERLSKIRELILGNEDEMGVIAQLENGSPIEAEKAETPQDSMLQFGFMYGETTTFIGGNIKFGGQLQDHIVNRFDVRTAYKLVEFYGLDTVDSAEDFSDTIDPIIRNQFGTEQLEDLYSEEHHVFDSQIKNLLEATGVNEIDAKYADTRTNVMIDFLLGKGDCRQHAHSKQLIFDSWKTFKLNNWIEALKNAQAEDDSAEKERIKGKIDELLRKQLFVFDSTISSKVQMNQLYDPKFQDGNYLVGDDFQAIEEHTWSGLVTFDEDGHAKTLEMADSFYQNEYGLGGRHQIITNMEDYANQGMLVTSMQALNPNTGEMEEVPVILTPTIYAGNRANRNISRHADIGGASLRGIPLGNYEDSVMTVLGAPEIQELWQAMAA